MNYTVLTYSFYLVLSISLTVWVARTLHRNGRRFLVDCFQGDESLADSVNHLLVVGFYLMNFGFVTLYLKLGIDVASSKEVFEALSGKMGVVMLALGGMHFFNVYLFHKMRRKALLKDEPPPVKPDSMAELGESA